MCEFCRQPKAEIIGHVLSLHCCRSCWTMEPTEAHWEIYRLKKAIGQRKWDLGAPERKRKADEARAAKKAVRALTLAEMTPKEIEEELGYRGDTILALRAEFAGLPELPGPPPE